MVSHGKRVGTELLPGGALATACEPGSSELSGYYGFIGDPPASDSLIGDDDPLAAAYAACETTIRGNAPLAASQSAMSSAEAKESMLKAAAADLLPLTVQSQAKNAERQRAVVATSAATRSPPTASASELLNAPMPFPGISQLSRGSDASYGDSSKATSANAWVSE